MPSPVVAIDHLRISVADLDEAIADYQRLLGAAGPRSLVDGAQRAASFDCGNVSLLLVESAEATGLDALCFQVDDLERIGRRLGRFGIDAEPLAASSQGWMSAMASKAYLHVSTRNLDILFTPRRDDGSPSTPSLISGLDHVVISSGNAEGTAFLLAAQLGLDMRMDMSRPQWGARLLFFRCGDAIVEVVQQLKGETAGAEDHFFGISWRVHDADDAHATLAGEHFDVSEVRTGRRPGTRVLTVRDRTADVATLLLEPPRG